MQMVRGEGVGGLPDMDAVDERLMTNRGHWLKHEQEAYMQSLRLKR